jgi:hypothetical protein
MRQTIALLLVGATIVALAVFLGTSQQPREDELARSIARLVETSR